MHDITHHQNTNFKHRRKNTEFPTTYMPTIVQQDATIYSLFISVNRSTCFGWYLHSSSGVHVTVSTASSISKTITATCRERDWTGPELLMMGGDTT